ncbi:MAG: hypothetical protein C0613_16000 [Desulfobulbaceae bacterium]|nr:MAG: hypothetical protein C0613_16000 [Desulfobulbaceae bacterium]
MEKIPCGRYTKEFREEAARVVLEGGLSAGEAAQRLSLPKSTLETWVRAAKAGKIPSAPCSINPFFTGRKQ